MYINLLKQLQIIYIFFQDAPLMKHVRLQWSSQLDGKNKSIHPNMPKTVKEYGKYLAGVLGGRFSHTLRGTEFFKG